MDREGGFRVFPQGVPAFGGVVRSDPVFTCTGAVRDASMAPSGVLHVAVSGTTQDAQATVSPVVEAPSGVTDHEGSHILLSQDNFVIDGGEGVDSVRQTSNDEVGAASEGNEEGVRSRVVQFSPGTKASDRARRGSCRGDSGCRLTASERDRRTRLYNAIFEQDESVPDVFSAGETDAGRKSQRLCSVVLRGDGSGEDPDCDSSGLSPDGSGRVSRRGSLPNDASGEVDVVGGLRSTEGTGELVYLLQHGLQGSLPM